MTVTVKAVPAVDVTGALTVKCVAAAAAVAIMPLTPLIVPFTVSAAVTV